MWLEKILGLKGITGLLVFPDVAEDGFEEYIVYTLEEEKNAFFGDDSVLAETEYIQINLYTRLDRSGYHELRKKIKKYLESVGFSVPSVQTITDKTKNNTLIKHTMFDVEITEGRTQEE